MYHFILLVVAELFDKSVTKPPKQNEVDPPAEIIGLSGIRLTTIFVVSELTTQPSIVIIFAK